MNPQLYEKVHEVWKDKPDKTTPVWGEDLEHFEQGIYDNSANIKTLAESGFITKTVNDLENYYKKSETYTKEEIAALIAGINTMQFSVVTELPTEDISTSTIYLVPAEDGTTGNIYNEYLYVNGDWEVIGNTAIDLSGYLKATGDASETVSSGAKNPNEFIAIEKDNDGYPHLGLAFGLTEKLRIKFATISLAFDELVSTIKSKIPSLTTSLAVTEEGVSMLDGTVGKVLDDKIAVNSAAISQINSDLADSRNSISIITFGNYAPSDDIISFANGINMADYEKLCFVFGSPGSYGYEQVVAYPWLMNFDFMAQIQANNCILSTSAMGGRQLFHMYENGIQYMSDTSGVASNRLRVIYGYKRM